MLQYNWYYGQAMGYYPAQRGCEKMSAWRTGWFKKPAGGRTPYHIGTIYEAIFILPNSSGLRPALDALVSGTVLVWVALDFDQCPGAKVHYSRLKWVQKWRHFWQRRREADDCYCLAADSPTRVACFSARASRQPTTPQMPASAVT